MLHLQKLNLEAPCWVSDYLKGTILLLSKNNMLPHSFRNAEVCNLNQVCADTYFCRCETKFASSHFSVPRQPKPPHQCPYAHHTWIMVHNFAQFRNQGCCICRAKPQLRHFTPLGSLGAHSALRERQIEFLWCCKTPYGVNFMCPASREWALSLKRPQTPSGHCALCKM